jgi:hypothetical protein
MWIAVGEDSPYVEEEDGLGEEIGKENERKGGQDVEVGS